MKELYKVSSYLFIVFLLATSCTNKEDTPRPQATGADILMAKNWRLTSDIRTITSNGEESKPEETYNQYPTCWKDNFWQFSVGNKLVEDEGATKCNPGHMQVTSGKWELSPDEKTFVITSETMTRSGALPNYSTIYEVLELSTITFRVKTKYVTPEDIRVENVYTFSSF